jgi:hypothetical protein
MTEGERIIKLETQMDNIEKKVDDGFKATDARFDNMEKLVKDFIEKSESKFASKWVEKVLWGAGAIIGTSLLAALLKLLLE